MASFKQYFLFIALFVSISVNNKMQAMALQDLPVDVVEIKEKVLPLGDIITCLKYCKVESDCDDSWLCTNCVPSAFEGWGAQCDKRTVTDKGYFGTILQARYNNII
ncbi:hypothetical protein P3L10_014140 [Capsicum annuum]|uniref:uncharacterized protein LOC124897905 n=1 Tax=Capsicum annuum TaxID=4072 RepID=UPI001FB171DF|nr:uncharacterized protein LOC124897905 [Capsicum annuum]